MSVERTRSLWELADFVRAARRRLRFGELSRAPLELLRVELRQGVVGCDWVVRPPDPADADLPGAVRERDAALQAVTDALDLRALVLDELPGIHTAVLRAFRRSGRGGMEVVIRGAVHREPSAGSPVDSPFARAERCGLELRLEDGVLRPLPVNGEPAGWADGLGRATH